MAKCSLARSIMLSSGGAISYVTPPTVEKAKSSHDKFVKVVDDAIKSYLARSSFKGIKLEIKDVCLTLKLKSEEYVVCGHPDIAYFIYGFNGKTLVIVGDVTLSPSVKHMVLGELVFYVLSYHLFHGTPTVGFIASPRSVTLMVPKLDMFGLLRRLFKKLDYERAVEEAERKRARSPWMCSLCDLKHLCPLGREM